MSYHTYLIIIFASIFTLGAGTGFLLKRKEKTYPVFLLTIHKLILLGAGVALGVLFIRKNQLVPLNTSGWLLFTATLFSFFLMIVTGGMVSIEKPMPKILQVIHKVFPYITVILSILSILLVL